MSLPRAWRLAKLQTSILLGHVRRLRSNVLQSWPGNDPNRGANLWVVYAHYDRRGRVFDFSYYALRALCDAGFRVVFVTNSRKFNESQLPQLKSLCAQIIKRRNVGYDFGAYQDGIAAIPDISSINTLILTNDSLYGPLFPLKATLDRMSAQQADIWGLTDTWEHAYHLQSYFLYFTQTVLASTAFQEFWKSMPLINHKRGVINRLEIGISQYFLAHGFRLSAVSPYHALVDRYLASLKRLEDDSDSGNRIEREALDNVVAHLLTGRSVNPTHHFWDTLIIELQHPFIKRELLSLNPSSVFGVSRWHRTISTQTEYDVEMIVEHLKHDDRRRWSNLI